MKKIVALLLVMVLVVGMAAMFSGCKKGMSSNEIFGYIAQEGQCGVVQ